MKLTFNTIKGHLYKHEWLHSGTVRTVAALSSPGGTHWLCVRAARETPGLTAVILCCQSHRVCVPGLCLWKRICLLSWVLFLWRNCQDGIHPCLFWKDSHSLNSILASKDIVLTEKKKRRSLTPTSFRLFHRTSAMVPLASSQLRNVLFTGGRFCPWPSIAQAVTPQGQHRKVAALCSSLAPLLFLIARNLH